MVSWRRRGRREEEGREGGGTKLAGESGVGGGK